MPDHFDDQGRKLTTAALICGPRRGLWLVQRAQGSFNNPGLWSLPGSDGFGGENLVAQLATRLGLQTELQDWERIEVFHNPHNNPPAGELKEVWLYIKLVADLGSFSPHGHELDKYAAVACLTEAQIGALDNQGLLSPAAKAVLVGIVAHNVKPPAG